MPSLSGLLYVYHGREARDLKLEIPGTPPTVLRICISLIFSLIMVGCAVGFLQTIQKNVQNHIIILSKWFSRKINNSKVIKDQLVFLPFARQ